MPSLPSAARAPARSSDILSRLRSRSGDLVTWRQKRRPRPRRWPSPAPARSVNSLLFGHSLTQSLAQMAGHGQREKGVERRAASRSPPHVWSARSASSHKCKKRALTEELSGKGAPLAPLTCFPPPADRLLSQSASSVGRKYLTLPSLSYTLCSVSPRPPFGILAFLSRSSPPP